MPFANEHSARVRNIEDFELGDLRRENIEDGIDTVIGKLKDKDDKAIIYYRFDISKFNSSQAEKWLQGKNLDYSDFQAATNEKIIEGHVFIYGEIIPFEDDEPGVWGGVNLKDVVNQIKSNQGSNRLVAHIHSPGGSVWEGFAIHDALVNSGKEVVTIIEGLCASIATIIALAGDKRLMTEHSEFMIHNPWTMGIGDSEDLKKQAEELGKTENKIAEFYAAKTNLTSDQLLNYMHNETFFTADEAKQYGFVTEVVKTMKQVASINKSKFYNKMTKEEQNKLNLVDKFFDKLGKLFGPKNIILADVNGKELDFPEVTDESEIKVGAKVNVDGNPANEDHQMPSGKTYVCKDGVLTEIKEKPADETQALKDEIATLKAENEKLKGEKTTTENKLQQIETESKKAVDEFKKFKAQFSKGNPVGANPPAGGEGNISRKPFKVKE